MVSSSYLACLQLEVKGCNNSIIVTVIYAFNIPYPKVAFQLCSMGVTTYILLTMNALCI